MSHQQARSIIKDFSSTAEIYARPSSPPREDHPHLKERWWEIGLAYNAIGKVIGRKT